MSTIDEILATMSEDDATVAIDELLIIDPNTRQVNIPGTELVFGVEHDSHSERKYFLCPRIVGNELDLTSCFIRVNYRNANGEIDSYLVDDVSVVGDNILFSWVLSKKVTAYRGQVGFVVCASRPGGNGAKSVDWHTTTAQGRALEGIEPDVDGIVSETGDALAALLATVAAQSENVIKEGATQVAMVQSEGATQVTAIQDTAEAAKNASVDEIEAKGTNTLASIPDDYTALSEAVSAIERATAPGIVCEVEGSSVFVTDASNNPVQNIRIFGKSTQDGVPSPDAPVEIVSVENPVVTVYGGNLLPYPYGEGTEKEMNGITFTVRDDGSILVNGTATEMAFFTFQYSSVRTPLPNGWLSTSTGQGYGSNVVQIQNDIYLDGEYFNAVQTVIEGSSRRYIPTGRLTLGASRIKVDKGVTINNAVVYPVLCNTEVPIQYERSRTQKTLPSTHTLPGIPVTSGGNYTDSDGQQWICDEVDLERGVYVQRVELKTFTLYKSPYEFTSLGYRYQHHAGNNFTPGNVCLCRTLPYNPNVGTDMETTDGVRLNNSAGYIIAQYTDADGTADSIDLDILYILPTPIETPLSEAEIAAYRALHTNKPNTTVLNDAGAHMAVAYIADTKLYIDNKIAAIVSGT